MNQRYYRKNNQNAKIGNNGVVHLKGKYIYELENENESFFEKTNIMDSALCIATDQPAQSAQSAQSAQANPGRHTPSRWVRVIE